MGCVEYLLACSKIRGEYRFGFTLLFGQVDAATEARLHGQPLVPIPAGALAARVAEGEPLAGFGDPRIVVTALASTAHSRMGMSAALAEDQSGPRAAILGSAPHIVLRAVNLSGKSLRAAPACRIAVGPWQRIEATGAVIEPVGPEGAAFPPFAVRTFAASVLGSL